jgi:tRNA 5-methylaminomethyl-2-thiouridine biosynthesis bifunctional protein
MKHHAIVIGGGIAGTASAHSLAQRGWRVTLIERHSKLAAEASGNHQGVLYARLSPKQSELGTLTLACYLYTLQQLPQLLPQGENTWQQCGVLQLAFNETESARQQALLQLGLSPQLVHGVSQDEAAKLAGVAVTVGGLYFPSGGWINPSALCAALVKSPSISVQQHEVTELKQVAEQWQVWGEGGLLASAPVVIVAGAASSNRFAQTAHLPLRSVRGQVSYFPATAASQRLNTVICGEGFVAPQRAGLHSVGSSYQDGDTLVDVREQDHLENLSLLQQLSPALHQGATVISGRAACRCSVPSNLPVVGEVSAKLHGLYVNTGHSSRGLVTALLMGEVLAASIEREPAPLPQKLLKSISPLRFERNSPKWPRNVLFECDIV